MKKIKIMSIEDKLIAVGAILATIFIVGGLVVKNYSEKLIDRQTQTLVNAEYSPNTPYSPTNSIVSPSERLEKTKVVYELLNGWNFIAFPIKPLNFTDADGLLIDIAQKGGYATVVARWDGDRWQEYIIRGNEKFGGNFPIVPGEGYFVRNNIVVSWSISGSPVNKDSVNPYQLKTGWNAVGLILNNQKAEQVLDNINQETVNATELDWWNSGSWEGFIKRTYSKDSIESYGVNFPIQKNKGYMVRLNNDQVWSNQ